MNSLQQLLRDHPTNSQAWNNLAYVARDKQCYQLAIKAARTAFRLAPQNSAIAATLDEMTTLPSTPDSEQCSKLCPLDPPGTDH
jgi:cytochrome c-type biogenesis protein CcmH/NrfG